MDPHKTINGNIRVHTRLSLLSQKSKCIWIRVLQISLEAKLKKAEEENQRLHNELNHYKRSKVILSHLCHVITLKNTHITQKKKSRNLATLAFFSGTLLKAGEHKNNLRRAVTQNLPRGYGPFLTTLSSKSKRKFAYNWQNMSQSL